MRTGDNKCPALRSSATKFFAAADVEGEQLDPPNAWKKKKTELGIHPESGKQGLTANTQNNKAMHAAEPTAGPKTNRALETTRSKRLGFYLAFRSFLLFQRPTGRLRRPLLFRVKSTPHSKISQSTNHPGAPPADGTTPPPQHTRQDNPPKSGTTTKLQWRARASNVRV